MKIINKVIGTLLVNFCVALVLFFLCDRAASMTYSIFSAFEDPENLRYEFIEYKSVNFVIATVLFSGFTRLIWQISLACKKTIPVFFAVLVTCGCALLAANFIYWDYLQKVCFSLEWSRIKDAFVVAFGSCERAWCFSGIYVCTIYAVGHVLNNFVCFVHDPTSRLVARLVVPGNELFSDFLCYLLPVWLILTGSYSVVGQFGVPVVWIVTVGATGTILFSFVSKIADYQRIRRYFVSAMDPEECRQDIAVVKEAKGFEKAFIYHNFLSSKEVMKKLDAANICILPEELVDTSRKRCIVLDVYDREMFQKKKEAHQGSFEEILRKRGTFNIAFCPDKNKPGELKMLYDSCVSGVDEAIQQIVVFKDFLEYREKQRQIVSGIQIERLDKSNILIDEIVNLTYYLDRTINSFLVFDYAIKWLEIINYIYSLIAASRKSLAVSDTVLPAMEEASIGKWIAFRQRKKARDKKLSAVLSETAAKEDRTAFLSFCSIWESVTGREHQFEVYSAEELLRAVKHLRDYTRGHGVFTFEISHTINLGLLEILVFLINRLIEAGLLDDDFQNLEELGWIVYVGEDPYFLYDYDSKYRECRFDSWRNGNSLALPSDIYEREA